VTIACDSTNVFSRLLAQFDEEPEPGVVE